MARIIYPAINFLMLFSICTLCTDDILIIFYFPVSCIIRLKRLQ